MENKIIKFEECELSENIKRALKDYGYVEATPIQAESIPNILEGKDVIGRSETGSGKTLAYLLPIFEKIDMDVKGTQAIILTPTHELAVQVFHQAELLQENSGMEADTGRASDNTIKSKITFKGFFRIRTEIITI